MKLENVKAKVKNYWEKNKESIIVTGAQMILVGGYCGFVASKCYKAGFIDGGMMTCDLHYEWLDETFPEKSNAMKLYNQWKELHPDEIMYHKGPGKWATK